MDTSDGQTGGRTGRGAVHLPAWAGLSAGGEERDAEGHTRCLKVVNSTSSQPAVLSVGPCCVLHTLARSRQFFVGKVRGKVVVASTVGIVSFSKGTIFYFRLFRVVCIGREWSSLQIPSRAHGSVAGLPTYSCPSLDANHMICRATRQFCVFRNSAEVEADRTHLVRPDVLVGYVYMHAAATSSSKCGVIW